MCWGKILRGSLWKGQVTAFRPDLSVHRSKIFGKICLPMEIRLGFRLGLALIRVRAKNR